MFGHPRVLERACGGGVRVVRVGDARGSGSAWCRWSLARLTAARCGWAWRAAGGDTAVRVGCAPPTPVGGRRGSSPRVGVVGGLRRAATRCSGSAVLRVAASVARASADARRGRERAEPGAAPDTAIGHRCHAHFILAVQVSYLFGHPSCSIARAAVGVWSAKVNPEGRAPRGARGCVARLVAARCGGRGRWRVRTRRVGSVALRVVPIGSGAARRREVWLGVAGRGWGHGGSCRWCSAWRPWVAGAAHRRGWRWWVASDVSRHGASGWGCSARPHRWHGLRGAAVRRVSPGTAEVSEPNPALHLTPPADSGRTAHRVMAVQVSFTFGQGGRQGVCRSLCGRRTGGGSERSREPGTRRAVGTRGGNSLP
ncbi:hypothetical protein GobsT_46780 [Gemmata obscuriglobus]|nr:hypothetical protein GobsT_46780 [Gemmata obscuriglobus]VTS09197.1 unnamed protein product [Gemmata obscuriglobus UQM 2246]